MQLTSYTVLEDTGFVSVCAVLTGLAEKDILVSVSTLSGTAQCK